MDSKHTPGPWKFGWETNKKDWGIVTDGGGNIIANVNTKTGPDLPPLVPRKMPADANAKLIAAAPDLLAVCRQLADLLEDPSTELENKCKDTSGMIQVWVSVSDVRQARAAIAKAEGE